MFLQTGLDSDVVSLGTTAHGPGPQHDEMHCARVLDAAGILLPVRGWIVFGAVSGSVCKLSVMRAAALSLIAMDAARQVCTWADDATQDRSIL